MKQVLGYAAAIAAGTVVMLAILAILFLPLILFGLLA